MKTDEDYLWDRSGEPDPEVQQLEEILGTLRYQPKPLVIPADLQVNRGRGFFHIVGPRLAIAATITMLLFGLGIWLGLRRLQSTQPIQVAEKPRTPAPTNSPNRAAEPAPSEAPNQTLAEVSPGSEHKSISTPRHRVSHSVIATNSNRPRSQAIKTEQLTAAEREGQAAKDQLMLALRLASMKVSFAQKKTQNVNSREPVHNQHKIG